MAQSLEKLVAEATEHADTACVRAELARDYAGLAVDFPADNWARLHAMAACLCAARSAEAAAEALRAARSLADHDLIQALGAQASAVAALRSAAEAGERAYDALAAVAQAEGEEPSAFAFLAGRRAV